MTDTQTKQVVREEFLALVEQERERTFAAWGDDFANGKSPEFLLQLLTKEVGKLNGVTLAEQNTDFNDGMVALQEQAVVVGGLLMSIYEQADRHRIEYLDALGELTEDE